MQFGLPDEACRAQILHQYAKHLSEAEVMTIAEASPGMAGRDLKDLSEQAESRWASKVSLLIILLLIIMHQMCCAYVPCQKILGAWNVDDLCVMISSVY